ncbi:2-hydroxyacid dehydrogenase [Paenibacillus swuensis]|uniref:2-hydroxyacid dehydrogenase n=1 Tax=Paenibacillus swuensis TaxID=1178515 RepID=A0A172TDU6_9BACL|nr:NAD(P)-dependent oxidoreductase [Paenibacillus swuensis]ANE45219.1 2-hydroxyacid dehydrogenase [Paenibacillus swuensis]
MRTVIIVHPDFDRIWPYTADRLSQLLQRLGHVSFIRLQQDSNSILAEVVPEPSTVTKLIILAVTVTEQDLTYFTALKEIYIGEGPYGAQPSQEIAAKLKEMGIFQYVQPSAGYWAQSVSEFALGLTIAALRRIPQAHMEIIGNLNAWDFPLEQFSDDPNFVNGTIEGKKVRMIGAGNIASRYASFVRFLGADVAAWDPFASEASFHRAGSRKEWHLEKLAHDADIFVPMVPLTPDTEGLVTAEIIRALPKGCLIILVTRAGICDTNELRRRVLADEISLAADVFDLEPLPLHDPLLNRHNVVHTPHIAGRTKDANIRWAEMLAEQFA